MKERKKRGVELIEKSAFYCQSRFRFAMMIGINHLKNIKLKKKHDYFIFGSFKNNNMIRRNLFIFIFYLIFSFLDNL